MPVQMPGIDQDTCREWTELDRDLYNTYSFWLAKQQVERRKTWLTFGKLVKRKPWKPNHGSTMKGVRTNRSPHLRQQVNPQPLTSNPKEDIVRVTETVSESILYWQDFSSPTLNFLPSFRDFLDHVSDHGEDMMEKIERFEELFYRTMMFHMSPFMFIAKGNSVELVNTIPFKGTTVLGANDGKSATLLSNLIAGYTSTASHLTLASLAHALTIMEVNLGILPFSGSGLPQGDDKALDQKFLLITGSEDWTQFSFDPYLQQHKNCDLDVVNGAFKGSIFGRITSRLESMPMHIKADGTMPEPELETNNNDLYNQYEPVPNPVYAGLGVDNSPWKVSYLCGNIGYDAIEVGPPPSAFTKDTPPDGFQGMNWNGEVSLTRNFLIECPDAVTGAVRYKTNSKARHIKYESTLAMGIHPRNRRSVIPILHKRKQGM